MGIHVGGAQLSQVRMGYNLWGFYLPLTTSFLTLGKVNKGGVRNPLASLLARKFEKSLSRRSLLTRVLGSTYCLMTQCSLAYWKSCSGDKLVALFLMPALFTSLCYLWAQNAIATDLCLVMVSIRDLWVIESSKLVHLDFYSCQSATKCKMHTYAGVKNHWATSQGYTASIPVWCTESKLQLDNQTEYMLSPLVFIFVTSHVAYWKMKTVSLCGSSFLLPFETFCWSALISF